MLHAFGIGNALVDFVVEVNDEFIVRADITKGIMTLVDERRFMNLMNILKRKKVTILPGGSSANTMIGIARMGLKSAYCGRVGDDFHSLEYATKLSDAGVLPVLTKVKGITGTCISMVTSDKERTMATCLASSATFEPNDVDFELLHSAKLLHVEGYQILTENQRTAALMAMRFAKEHKILVSFDMSDPFVVHNHKNEIKSIVEEFADIVFLNGPEAKEFCGLLPKKAIMKVGRKDAYVGIKLGKEGSLVRKGNIIEQIPIHKVKAVDTTGAGDLYAAGFLSGIIQGKSLRECGLIASYLAGEIVSQYGAYLQKVDRTALFSFINKNLPKNNY